MKVLISCGEPSGDLYAGALTRELRALSSSARVFGLGGDGLRAAGGDVVEDYHGLTVTGLSEALAVLPRSYSIYRRLVALARRERPDVFVPVDFPDFNFRLAASIKRMGIPVVYYICPQLWAWRRGRLKTIKRFATRTLVIFPFEAAIYREAGIPVEFVGHPLLDLAAPTCSSTDFEREYGLDPRAPTVAVLPGSRPNEVRAILPVLVEAMRRISHRVPTTQFVVARAPRLDDALFAPLRTLAAGATARPPIVVASRTDDVLEAADVVVTASGTATVQAALHKRPMVIVYRLSPLTFRIVKAFAHVDSVGMVNLIAGKTVAPELIQDDFTPQAVADAIVTLLLDPELRERTRGELEEVCRKLGGGGASRRAAEAVVAVAESGRGR